MFFVPVQQKNVIVTKALHRHQSIAFVYIDFLVYMQNELYVSQNKGLDLTNTYIYDLYVLLGFSCVLSVVEFVMTSFFSKNGCFTIPVIHVVDLHVETLQWNERNNKHNY